MTKIKGTAIGERSATRRTGLVRRRLDTGLILVEGMVTLAPVLRSRFGLNVLCDGKAGYSPAGKIHRRAQNHLPMTTALTLRCRHRRQDPIQTAQPFDRACAGQCRESLRL